MANSTVPSPGSRRAANSAHRAHRARRSANLVLRGAALSMFVALLPSVAGAQPLDRRQSVGSLQDQAKQIANELDQLDQKTNAVDEQYNDASLQLEGLRAKLAVNQADVTASRSKLEANRTSAQQYAMQAFVGSTDKGSDLVGLGDDAVDASRRRTYLASRYGDSEAVIDGLVAAQKDLADQEAALAAANSRVDAKLAEISRSKDELQATITARQKLQASVQGQLKSALEAEQQRQAAAAEAKARAEAEAAAARAAAARRAPAVAVRTSTVAASGVITGGRTAPTPGAVVTSVVATPAAAPAASPPPADAPTAVRVALEQQGDPYVWAAAGPDAFDCSGLVLFAYRAAGVSLPHSSRALRAMTQSISADQLQPGDLVFGGSPVHHVGIYIGNGQMVNAPHSGDVVRVAGMYSSSKPVSFGRL